MRPRRWRSAAIMSTIWRRRATRSASRRVASSGKARTWGLVACAKRAITAAFDGIGLGALPDGFGEVAHLRRVHHHHGQPGRRQSGGGHALEATGGLDGDQHRLEDTQLFAQLRQTLAVAPGDKRAVLGKNRYVEPVLGNVDAYDPASHLHHHPSLPNRASLAAQATVRVRWNDGRGIALSYGLGGPRTRRSPLRHRVDQYTRSRRNRITRTRAAYVATQRALRQTPRACSPADRAARSGRRA